MKKVVWILFIIFLSTAQAEYLRTIRIGSYPSKASAKAAYEELQRFLKTQPKIAELEKHNDFIFKYRPSTRNYYIMLAEPFRDRKTLEAVLQIIRKKYPDAYVKRLKDYVGASKKKKYTKSKPKKTKQKPKQVKLEPKQDSPQPPVIPTAILEQKAQSFELKPKEQTPTTESKELFQEENISIEEPKEIASSTKVIPNQTALDEEKNQKRQIPQVPNEPKTVSSSYLNSFLGYIFLVLSAFLGYLLYKKHKEAQHLQDRLLINDEKNKQLAKELQNYKQWIAHITQEVKTPLTTIVGLTNVALDTSLNKEQKMILEEIDQSADYMMCLLNDVVDISSIEAGKVKLHYNEFNLSHIIQYVYDIVSLEAKHRNITILTTMDKDIPSKLYGDSIRLSQILINILSNAIKFSKDCDIYFKIKKVEALGRNVTLEFIISDQGVGITSKEIQKLFHRYSTVDADEIKKEGQTGLGLYISKALVDLMKGKIDVKSQKGVGTTFKITLNFTLKDAEDKRLYRLPSKNFLNKKVLIVDSHNKSAIPLMQAFSYFKYDVSNITSLLYLEEKLASEEFDIIVLNLFNITQNKIEQINKAKDGKNIKVVIYNELYNTMSHNLLNLQVDAFLKPPITIQSVLELITELYMPKRKAVIVEHPLKKKLKHYAGKKILVAEDNELHHKVIAGMLKDTNIEATFVESGDKIVEILQKGIVVDLIMLDLHLAHKDGFEIAKEIRKDHKFDTIPIVALSSKKSQELVDKVLHSGMQALLQKPIKLEEFYKTILEYFQKEKFVILSEEKTDALLNSDEEGEFSIQEGLARCNNDKEMFKTLLKEFLKMYQYVSYDINNLCKEGEFQKARYKAMDVKDVALNLGAYKFAEAAAMMEYELERGNQSHWRRHLKVFDKLLRKLFEDIQRYLQTN